MSRPTSIKHVATRSCVGCRRRAPQPTLLRVARRDGEILPDVKRVLPGRGAYIHRETQCLERALGHGGFARAFRSVIKAEHVPSLRGRISGLFVGEVG